MEVGKSTMYFDLSIHDQIYENKYTTTKDNQIYDDQI